MNLANGPRSILTRLPGPMSFNIWMTPCSLHLLFSPSIILVWMGRYTPSSVTADDMPFVPLMLFQGTGSVDVPMKRYPGNSGAVVSKNLLFFCIVLIISGRKTSKPCRSKWSHAVACPLDFVWRRYQFTVKKFHYWDICSTLSAWQAHSLKRKYIYKRIK